MAAVTGDEVRCGRDGAARAVKTIDSARTGFEGGDTMDVQLADVTVHINETLDSVRRAGIESKLRAIDGVISVHNTDERPHLVLVEFVPEKTSASTILQSVRSENVNAALVGL